MTILNVLILVCVLYVVFLFAVAFAATAAILTVAWLMFRSGYRLKN